MLKINDANNFRRTLTGLCLIAAPLLLLLAMLVHPGGGQAGLVQTVSDHPDRVVAANLLIVFSSVLFVPALVGILNLLRGRGVVLGHIGVGLAVIGVIGHAAWASFQFILVAMAQGAVSRAQLSDMIEGGPPNAGFIAVLFMFMVGFFPGMVLLAISLWRGRVAPAWVTICILAMVLWDFVPLGGGAIVAAIGSALGLIGLGWIGVKVLAMPDADWQRGRSPSSGGVAVGTQPRVQ